MPVDVNAVDRGCAWPVGIRAGPSCGLPPLDPDDRSASLRRNADEVMCHLAALMPPERRGVYAEHPRLRELLAAGAATAAAA